MKIFRTLFLTLGLMFACATLNACSQYSINSDGSFVLSRFPSKGDDISAFWEAFLNRQFDPRFSHHDKPTTFRVTKARVFTSDPYAPRQVDSSDIGFRAHVIITLQSGQIVESDFVDHISVMWRNNRYQLYGVSTPGSYDPTGIRAPLNLAEESDAYIQLSRPFVSNPDLVWQEVSVMAFLVSATNLDWRDKQIDLSGWNRTHELALSRHDLLGDQ